MTALFSKICKHLVTAGAICGALASSGALTGCAMPVGQEDDGVSANRLTSGEEAQMGANPDSSSGDPRTTRMATGPEHGPDPSPWVMDVLQVGVVIGPPTGPGPAEEPDPSPWMHKVDTTAVAR